MNLYHWPWAECLEEYSCGDIIVVAPSIEEARQKARANIDALLKGSRSWWFRSDGTVDPDEAEYYREFIQKLERDLKKDPDLVQHGTIYIRGSE